MTQGSENITYAVLFQGIFKAGCVCGDVIMEENHRKNAKFSDMQFDLQMKAVTTPAVHV